ncbi:hypothetical protein I7I50_01321 [Histoplasma capsulatum G186AR]|uniref:Uncharacterized protein n=1 Tax=Ajellomyces capsulatus TaxID=5037 RepID=A0A8H7YYP3_AJECA|nr:hypothetical protein I7I52_08852 [Histoplasma capsulatum]QSS73229.1 hypothetical protein I7I50_01321 [Histoplasma capsulatum G186AR]
MPFLSSSPLQLARTSSNPAILYIGHAVSASFYLNVVCKTISLHFLNLLPPPPHQRSSSPGTERNGICIAKESKPKEKPIPVVLKYVLKNLCCIYVQVYAMLCHVSHVKCMYAREREFVFFRKKKIKKK